jgi:hypothetical protein
MIRRLIFFTYKELIFGLEQLKIAVSGSHGGLQLCSAWAKISCKQ